MRIQTVFGALTVLAGVVLAAPAEARHVRFLGAHPIAAKQGGGYCYIESPHLHIYAPDHAALYQQVGDEYVFTGDPTPFGYEGDKHTFYGHHPMGTVGEEPVFCLLDGPHFHAYAPPETPDFKVKQDVAFYVGAPLPVRPQRVKLVNAEYRPYVTLRPTVTVEPPPEYHAELVVGVPSPPVLNPFEGPSVTVNAPLPPSVYVTPPRPRVSVQVNAPGVVFAPPPSIYVSPPSAHVVIGAPGPVFVGGSYQVHGHYKHQEHWEHHDNGRHNGWGKHGR